MKINGNKDINDKESKIHLKNTIDELTRKFIDHITKWEAAGKPRIVKIDESLSNVLKKRAKDLKEELWRNQKDDPLLCMQIRKS